MKMEMRKRQITLVLILVVVEDVLVPKDNWIDCVIVQIVLILVVVEDVLVLYAGKWSVKETRKS